MLYKQGHPSGQCHQCHGTLALVVFLPRPESQGQVWGTNPPIPWNSPPRIVRHCQSLVPMGTPVYKSICMMLKVYIENLKKGITMSNKVFLWLAKQSLWPTSGLFFSFWLLSCHLALFIYHQNILLYHLALAHLSIVYIYSRWRLTYLIFHGIYILFVDVFWIQNTF